MRSYLVQISNITSAPFFWFFFKAVALHIHKAFKQMNRLFHCTLFHSTHPMTDSMAKPRLVSCHQCMYLSNSEVPLTQQEIWGYAAAPQLVELWLKVKQFIDTAATICCQVWSLISQKDSHVAQRLLWATSFNHFQTLGLIHNSVTLNHYLNAVKCLHYTCVRSPAVLECWVGHEGHKYHYRSRQKVPLKTL